MADGSRKGIGGPRTEAGMRQAAMNAHKTGLYVRSQEGLAILEERIGCTYAETLQQLRAHYKPKDPVEEMLVRRIARSTWRVLVTELAENIVLGNSGGYIDIDRPYMNVIHTERFVDIHLHRAITALQLKRDRECDKTENELTKRSTAGISVEHSAT